jgi:hypothetical protein
VSESFIAIHIVARLDATTFEEREALEERIIQALGCDNTEADCPMVIFASTVVKDVDTAVDWLHA